MSFTMIVLDEESAILKVRRDNTTVHSEKTNKMCNYSVPEIVYPSKILTLLLKMRHPPKQIIVIILELILSKNVQRTIRH